MASAEPFAVRFVRLRHTLAIVEDEPDLLEALEEYFSGAGFEVIALANAAAFRQIIEERRVHLAILDINMPGEDGLSLARWIKTRGPMGLILATALGRPIDRVVGLDIGADDYVVKPYNLRELLARVRVVLRRQGDHLDGNSLPTQVAGPAPVHRVGGLTLDPDRRALLSEAGVETPLSAADFAVLALLCSRPGQTFSRQALAESADPEGRDAGDRAIDVRITRLRKKLATVDPDAGALLRSVRGEGYVLDKPGTTPLVFP